jgi:carboxypeptidase C (cathepsin A)
MNSTLGWLDCINAFEECNVINLEPIEFTGVNVYDVREQCQDPPLCYDFSLVNEFLAQPYVQQALGVVGRTWTSCNRFVELVLTFAGDWMLNYADDVPLLLANNVNVLVYSGEYDFICNWYGGNAWTHALQVCVACHCYHMLCLVCDLKHSLTSDHSGPVKAHSTLPPTPRTRCSAVDRSFHFFLCSHTRTAVRLGGW